MEDIIFKIKWLIVEVNVETKEGLKEDLAIQLGRMATKLSGGKKLQLKSRGSGSVVPKEMAEEEDDDDNSNGRPAIHDAESDKDAVAPQQSRERRRISSKALEELDCTWNYPPDLQEQKITM